MEALPPAQPTPTVVAFTRSGEAKMSTLERVLVLVTMLAGALWPASADAGCAPVAALIEPSSGTVPRNPVLSLFLTLAGRTLPEIIARDQAGASLPLTRETLWSGPDYVVFRLRIASGDAQGLVLSLQWSPDYPGTTKWEYSIDANWKRPATAKECCRTRHHGDFVEVAFRSEAAAFRIEWQSQRRPSKLASKEKHFSVVPTFSPESTVDDGVDGPGRPGKLQREVAINFGSVPCFGRTTSAGFGRFYLTIVRLHADGSEEVVTPRRLPVLLTRRSRCSPVPGQPGRTVCGSD